MQTCTVFSRTFQDSIVFRNKVVASVNLRPREYLELCRDIRSRKTQINKHESLPGTISVSLTNLMMNFNLAVHLDYGLGDLIIKE